MPAAMTTSTGLFICNSSYISRGFRRCSVLRLLYTASPPVARCRGGNDFECAPRCSAHHQRKNYFKFRVCRALRSATNAIFTEGVVEGNSSCRACFLRKRPHGGVPLPSAPVGRSHLPQGDGFSGGDKVFGTAQRRPLGGAGERSETEGVGWASYPISIPNSLAIPNLHIVQFLVAKLLSFSGKYCILVSLSASIACQNIRIFEKKHLSMQTRKRGQPL